MSDIFLSLLVNKQFQIGLEILVRVFQATPHFICPFISTTRSDCNKMAKQISIPKAKFNNILVSAIDRNIIIISGSPEV